MTNIDTFVFDLDGTLLDTLPDLVVVTNTALERCGFPQRTQAQILSYVGNGARALMYQAVPQGTPAAQAEKAVETWRLVHAEYDHVLTKPYRGTMETLHRLKQQGARLAILSNKFDGGVKDMQHRFFADLCSVAYGECETIPRKPDPSGLLRVVDELGSSITTTAYVGDSPGDIVVAHNAGCLAVGATWGYRSEEDLIAEGADVLVATMPELLNLCNLPS